MKPTTIPRKKKAARAATHRGPLMNGAETLVASLEREGVDTIFAYPGGASQLLHQALTKSKKIRTILPRHEQGGGFMAGGYARATGRVGVCMATSGPGATNLVTALADAFMDSIPVVSITGQVPSYNIGKGAFQETDFFGLTLPIVKHSYLVMDAAEIPRIVKEAFYIANSGRPGPVVIDIPKDVQLSKTQPIFPSRISLRGYNPTAKADDLALNEVLGLIEKAEKPVLYVGGGIIASGASKELLEFAELTNIPVTTTLMGIGCFPETHPLSLKWLGMHGTYYANRAVNEADLLLAFGVRFDDRVTGKVSEFAKHGTIVHIDIDYAEFDKNKHVHLPILSDVKYALGRLNQMIRKEGRARKTFPAWKKDIESWRAAQPLRFKDYDDKIAPQLVIQKLCEMTKGEAIITTGVGQHQMWGRAILRLHPAAHLSHVGRPRHDGLRLSRGAGREGGVPGQAGDRHRRRRQLSHERAGAGHLQGRKDRREGDHPEQPAPRHGGAVGGSFFRQQPRPHLPRRPGPSRRDLSRLPDDLRRLRCDLRAGAPPQGP